MAIWFIEPKLLQRRGAKPRGAEMLWFLIALTRACPHNENKELQWNFSKFDPDTENFIFPEWHSKVQPNRYQNLCIGLPELFKHFFSEIGWVRREIRGSRNTVNFQRVWKEIFIAWTSYNLYYARFFIYINSTKVFLNILKQF